MPVVFRLHRPRLDRRVASRGDPLLPHGRKALAEVDRGIGVRVGAGRVVDPDRGLAGTGQRDLPERHADIGPAGRRGMDLARSMDRARGDGSRETLGLVDVNGHWISPLGKKRDPGKASRGRCSNGSSPSAGMTRIRFKGHGRSADSQPLAGLPSERRRSSARARFLSIARGAVHTDPCQGPLSGLLRLHLLGVPFRAERSSDDQPIEPDPGHAGGGIARWRARQRPHRTPEIFQPRPERCSIGSAAERTRVHAITNAAAQVFTANLLLAAGGIPSLTVAPGEVADFTSRSGALLVNLGTLDTERRAGIASAIAAARAERKPWVLDPVFVDASPLRLEFARQCLAGRPSVLRCNASEFAALACAEPSPGRSVLSRGTIARSSR